MSRYICPAVIVLTLAACATSGTAPTDPTQATQPTQPTSPANISGEWIDTTTYPGQPAVWHITQNGAAVSIVDTSYDRDDSVYLVLSTAHDSATVASDTVHFLVCGACAASTGIVANNAITFVAANGRFVRGTWTPPAAPPAVQPSDTLLAGTWISDSLAWEVNDPSCVGVIQYGIVMGTVIDEYPPIYQGYIYVRLCGSTTWTEYTWNVGQEIDSTLTFSQEQPVPTPNVIAGDNWWLKAAAADTLLDVTPDSINAGWHPPRFYRVDTTSTQPLMATLRRLRASRPKRSA